MAYSISQYLHTRRDLSVAFDLGFPPVGLISIRTAEKRCRRSGLDRRQFTYTAHIPERRCGRDRRKHKLVEV